MFFVEWIHNESVYFFCSVKVACRLLYSIFKIWKIFGRVHTESVCFLGGKKLWIFVGFCGLQILRFCQ